MIRRKTMRGFPNLSQIFKTSLLRLERGTRWLSPSFTSSDQNWANSRELKWKAKLAFSLRWLVIIPCCSLKELATRGIPTSPEVPPRVPMVCLFKSELSYVPPPILLPFLCKAYQVCNQVQPKHQRHPHQLLLPEVSTTAWLSSSAVGTGVAA
jgi:hypothetical protein